MRLGWQNTCGPLLQAELAGSYLRAVNVQLLVLKLQVILRKGHGSYEQD